MENIEIINENCVINTDDDYNLCCGAPSHPIYKYEVESFPEVLLKINSNPGDPSSVNFEEYIFIITQKLDKKPDITSFLCNLKLAQAILITFQTCDSTTIFWKLSSDDKLKSVDLDSISAEFCRQFLAKEIKKGRNGILDNFSYRSEFDLKHIGSENGRNLLILAAMNSQNDVVENLIGHNLDVNHEDISGCNAIEKVWENYLNDDSDKVEIEKIMLSLLRANSKFPRACYTVNNNEIHFEFIKAPKQVRDFIIKCENIHDMSIVSEYEKIEKELAKEPNMKYFYNRNNKSLMAHALSSGKMPVCKLLISLRVSIGQHEIDDLEELYTALNDPQKKALQSEHRSNAIELPKLHITTLLMLSKIGINDRQHEEHWNCIEEAFKVIDTVESCSKILKIAAIYKKFTIYFDFDHETIYYLDPKSKPGSLARIYGINTVYIGAKHLNDEIRKYEVYGAIIHELCHFAVFVTYINGFNPYPMGLSNEKTQFIEAVDQCIENKEIEEFIIGTVLEYSEKLQHSEFIVRPVQMMMHYYDQTPSMAAINSELLNERRLKFEKLFKYHQDVVEKDFDELLKIFKIFLDDKQPITYDELTGPWKARILHSNINFQGQITSFNDVIQEDHEILKLMTAKQIREMLWEGKSIEIADEIRSNEGNNLAERNFIDCNSDISHIKKEEVKNVDEIISHVEESQTFILSDAPGAGKTTAFKCLALKLKSKYKSCWVSMIELRKCQDIFKKFDEKNIPIERVEQMLLQILNLEPLEAEIFKKLFINNKVIFLFDAVDEISPHFNKFIIDVLKRIKKDTQNQILVSSRPHHGKQLTEKLNVKPFRLVPFSWKEKEGFILKMLQNSENYDDNKKDEVLNDFSIFFKSIKNIGYFNYDIDNPLMVKIITELYKDDQIDLKKQSLDLYEIFEKIEMSHKEQVDTKVAFKDRDPFSTISLEKVHQALALLLLYAMQKDELNETYIIGMWNENKKDLTAERIQRYGFVRIGFDFKVNDNFALDFTHRTYAEFFVAKFMLTFLFNVEDYMKDEELVKVIKVIKVFVNMDTIDNIFGFIMCYMKNEAEGRRFVLKKRIKQLILKEFNEIKNGLFFDPNTEQLLFLKFFSVFFIREQAVLNDFWLLDKEQNMLRIILIETDVIGYFKLHNLLETLSISFGENWHQVFNKSQQSLIKSEEIGEIEGNQNFSSNNSTKIC
ncbi:uncharacterized protein [Chironomus tepperi]|uniref:uncharacterized protein n=1 Tax=Chironomus tepperi TaxID=113505 RepID=UPI00391F6CF5